MAWGNPPLSWAEFERRLSGRRRPGGPPGEADGGDSPAWSSARKPYAPADVDRPEPPAPGAEHVPYAELHCHSNFSFLDGASSPEELVEQAVRLGLEALALTDHDGFYGVARMAEAAEAYDLGTIFGAELSLDLQTPQNGIADPEGTHLLVLARGEEGYHRLAGAITEGQLDGGEKGRPTYDLERLAEQAGASGSGGSGGSGSSDGHWRILTGCRKGPVPHALLSADPTGRLGSVGQRAALRELDRLTALFGRDNVTVELIDHGHPMDTDLADAMAEIAARQGIPTVATNNVHAATSDRRRLASALAAVRARRSLDEFDGWLPATGAAFLRSGTEMASRFERFPGAVARSVELARELAFPLRRAKPGLPRQDVPDGLTPMAYLRELVRQGARERYGAPESPTDPTAYARLELELKVIEEKDFPGYFLIVHDIVRYARERGILCQGRGSAANSAVCYVLGITAVDAVFYQLPFERFLSSTREEEPDIDVDFDSDRREEVIQYVYGKYGRRNAAQVANVISYRPKMAVRDMAKALGYSPGQQDAWSRQMDSWGSIAADAATEAAAERDGRAPSPGGRAPGPGGRAPGQAYGENDDESRDEPPPPLVLELARDLLTFPRHLGIHSGGMVLTDRPVGEVCPIEHARKENRTVLQWDKDDCAWMGLVKFDLLGLGMLAALQYALDAIRDRIGEGWTLDSIPKEEQGVYDMLCRADSVGVFQVESRAQMATLPRLRPRAFYDLVIEIALIRPGPIQGGAVHPYIRRKLGKEDPDPPHPSLENALRRTLGVPLFQEQLMQIAMEIGDCTGDDADLLRRAMGSKRGLEKISSLRQKLYDGMAKRKIVGATADMIYEKIEAFADFGFAESHSISFALLVYASAWLKLHYPAAFLAALLRAQPMGFYSPQTLVSDARRHGVEVRGVDLERSDVHAGLEPLEPLDGAGGLDGLDGPGATGDPACVSKDQPPVAKEFDPAAPIDDARHRRDTRFAVRLGLAGVKSIGEELAARIVEERAARGAYRDMEDLARRVGPTAAQLEALATAGAFGCLGLTRREALWRAGSAAREHADQLPIDRAELEPDSGTPARARKPKPARSPDLEPKPEPEPEPKSQAYPMLPEMAGAERVMADLWATGITPDDYPTRYVRPELDARGVVTAARLRTIESGRRIVVGGIVTHRQRPATAAGVTFLNLEDETGMVNVICPKPVWDRFRRIARDSSAVMVRGRVERAEGVTNVLAEKFAPIPLTVRSMSRDFQ